MTRNLSGNVAGIYHANFPMYYIVKLEITMPKRQPSRKVSSEKARKILRHGEVRGKQITKKQRGLFGAAAGRSKR